MLLASWATRATCRAQQTPPGSLLLHARSARRRRAHTASITLQCWPTPSQTTCPPSRPHIGRASLLWDEPGDAACLSAKDSDPRIAQLANAALITFLAYFMLRAGYS